MGAGPRRFRGLVLLAAVAVAVAVVSGWGFALSAAVPEPPAFGDTATAISESGQFVVTGPRSAKRRPMETRRSGETLREPTPQTLVVSCERVKDAVLGILELQDRWRNGGGRTGKIFVGIDPTLRTNAPLAVEASAFEQGWQFKVAIPSRLTEDRLVRVMTQAVTMELGSRGKATRPGEPPLWFVEGLTQLVLSRSAEGVILQPETRGTTDARAGAGVDRVRDLLTRDPPLPFHELGQPDLDSMDLRKWDLYAACAHLCCRELLRLPQGRAKLARWLENLQTHWNWQTGFIEAFQPQFRSLLDVEKWWALVAANFTGRNAASTWSNAFALRKLDEALHPLGLASGAAGRPVRLSVEEVLVSWDFSRQGPLLRQLQQQLQAIRVNSPAKVGSLAYRYAEVLDDYLDARARAGFAPAIRGGAPANVRWTVRQAVGGLRQLDGERARLAAEPEPAPRTSEST